MSGNSISHEIKANRAIIEAAWVNYDIDQLKSVLATLSNIDGLPSPAASNELGVTVPVTLAAKLGAEGLKVWTEYGGTFESQTAARDITGASELQRIARHAGYDGLKCYLDNGGLVHPSIKNQDGLTEAAEIADNIGVSGLMLFYHHGGEFDFTRPREHQAVCKALGLDTASQPDDAHALLADYVQQEIGSTYDDSIDTMAQPVGTTERPTPS